MKFRQATAANVAEHRSKMNPKVVEENDKKENDIPVAPAPEPAKDNVLPNELKVLRANEAKEAMAIISVNLRLEPGLYGEIVCTLFPGIKVRVNDSEDPDWYALTYQGRDCYVMKKYMKLL